MTIDFAETLNVKLNERLLSDDSRVNDKNSANNKRLAKFVSQLRDSRMIDALIDADVDARAFDQNVYAIEKIMRVAALIVDKRASVRDIDDNTLAMFRTSVNFFNARVKMTRDDLKCAISRSVQKDETARNLTYVRRNAYDEEKTISTQSSSSISTLSTLNMLREVSRDVFELQINSFTLAMCAELNLTLREDESEESAE